MDIKPLKNTVSPKGGRPTKYRKGLADEIMAYLEFGLSPHKILDGLNVSMNELKRWSNKKGMFDAHEAMQEALSDKAREEIAYAAFDEAEDYDTQLSHGEIEAVRTLRLILRTGTSDSAKVQAAKELLDRKRGKPVQTTHVEQNTTYTIIAAIPAPPNSASIAGQPDIEGDCKAITE